MGNSVAKDLALAEANELMDQVTRKCDSFIVGVENTSVVVNVELTELKAEISALIQPFQERPFRAEVGMLEMAKIIEDIERHANCHKHAIWAMLAALNDCQGSFEEFVSSKMSIDNIDNMVSDTAVSNELRLLIEKIVSDYIKDMRGAGCWDELVNLRSAELERMLFKLGDSIIIQIKENIVNQFKNVAFEQIDEILCSEMCDGTLSDPESARSLLQSFVTLYALTRDRMEDLPFLQRVQIERAQDKLSEYVEDLIRRVQLVYSYHFDESSMRMIMDLEESDDSSDEDSDDEDSETSDEEEEAEDEDEASEAVEPSSAKKSQKATPAKAKKTAPAKSKAATPKKKAAIKKVTPKKSPAVLSEEGSATPAIGKRKRTASAKVLETATTPATARSRAAEKKAASPVTTRKRARK